MATAQEIIDTALATCGAYGPGQTPAPEHRTAGMTRLRTLLEQYQNVNGYCYGTDIQVFTLSTSKQTYPLGPSAAGFTVPPRPAQINKVNLLLANSPGARIHLQMLTADQWGDRSLRVLAGSVPNQVFCQSEAPNWNIWLFPYPTDMGNQLEFFMSNPISTLTSLSDTLVAPEGYEGALTTILAEMMCPIMHRPVTPDLRDHAMRARKMMLNLNSASTPITTDIGSGSTSYFNWLNGSLVPGPGR